MPQLSHTKIQASCPATYRTSESGHEEMETMLPTLKGVSRSICCVCGKTKASHPKVTLHLFPKDAKRRLQWVQNLNVPYVKQTQVVCGDHFEACHMGSKGNLLSNAVPRPTNSSEGEMCGGFSEQQYSLGIRDVKSVKASLEDIEPLTKGVGTDMLDSNSSKTTVKLPQYDCFGTEFGMLPNPLEIEDPQSQSQRELPIPLSPPAEQVDDVSEDPLSPSRPMTTVNLHHIDASKAETVGPPKKMMRRAHHFNDAEMLVVAQEVEKRKDFILGSVDDKHARAMKDIAWQEIVDEVNAISRVHRSVEEVAGKFYQMQSNLKKRIPVTTQHTEGSNDVDPISQGIWTKWEKVLLRLPSPVIKPTGTAGENLPSTSGTVKRYGRPSSSPSRDNGEYQFQSSHVFSDSDSDDSLPPSYAAAGDNAVIVIDGEKHQIKIFDAHAEGDNTIRNQESTSRVTSSSTAEGATSLQHSQRTSRGNYALVPEFIRAQDEMRDLLEELIQAQQESTAATERAAAAIRQSAEAQMVSAQAIRASATALTTLASSMKSWLQRHPQRR